MTWLQDDKDNTNGTMNTLLRHLMKMTKTVQGMQGKTQGGQKNTTTTQECISTWSQGLVCQLEQIKVCTDLACPDDPVSAAYDTLRVY